MLLFSYTISPIHRKEKKHQFFMWEDKVERQFTKKKGKKDLFGDKHPIRIKH